jgi:hypothetical protein
VLSTQVISAFSKNAYTTAFDTQITDHFVYVFIVVKTQPPWMKYLHELHLISNIWYFLLLLFIRCSYKRWLFVADFQLVLFIFGALGVEGSCISVFTEGTYNLRTKHIAILTVMTIIIQLTTQFESCMY